MPTARVLILGVAVTIVATAGLAGCGSSGDTPSERDESMACASELATVRTAVEAWNARASTEPNQYPTPWPTGEDTTFGGVLQRAPTRFVVTGNGTTRPTIAALPGKCPDTDLDVNQIDQAED